MFDPLANPFISELEHGPLFHQQHSLSAVVHSGVLLVKKTEPSPRLCEPVSLS